MARVRLLLLCVCVPFFWYITLYSVGKRVRVHCACMFYVCVCCVCSCGRTQACIMHTCKRSTRINIWASNVYVTYRNMCVCVNSKSSHHKTSGSFNVSFCFSYFCFSTYSYLSLPFWAKSRLCSAKWLYMYWYYYALWQPHTYSHILGSHVVGELSRAVALSSTPVTAPYRFAVGQFSPLFFT